MTITRLRPVPTTGSPTVPATGRRARDVARLDPGTRAVRAAVARWALQVGRRCDLDAVTVVLACAAERGDPTVFTEEMVWQMWWVELADWCNDRGVAVPDGLATAMRLVFDHLHATDGFGPGSDPVDDLVEGMAGAGALWRDERTPLGAG